MNDKELLKLLANKIKKSKSMPKEFNDIIDKNFWDLI